MQEKSIQKIVSTIMVLIIIFTSISALLITKTYAITQSKSDDIYHIDENLYPGYETLLQNLKKSHPNWNFTLLYTDLEWNEVLINETTVNHRRSLVQGKTGEWLCKDTQCVNTPHDGATWFGASQIAVAYYIDPRNFLTEDKIFQFETLSYAKSVQNEAGVEAILKNTFMSNIKISEYYKDTKYGDKTFAQTILYAAEQSNVSPYHLASRIKQEIGPNGSDSSSGKYSGYVGYFNFYNIGANSGKNPVENGLKYAKQEGWDTPEKSIVAGAKFLAEGYIAEGQDSIYLQKWDVDNKSLGIYIHQYQQNIEAPTKESSSVYATYKSIFNNDLKNTSFNFVIPMYKHIPKTISRYPNNSYVTQNVEISSNSVNSVYIRKTPNGDAIGLYKVGTSLLRLECKTTYVSNEYWDKVMLSDGTIGYIMNKYVKEKTCASNCSKKAYVNEFVEVLNGPKITTNGTVSLRLLFKGQDITVIEDGIYKLDGYDWSKIKLADGLIGYVPKKYVTEGSYGEEVKITCPTSQAFRKSPGFNAEINYYIGVGKTVKRIEKATTKVGGCYWDKVMSSDGLVGYMAREVYDPYILYLTPVNNSFKIDEANKIISLVPGITLKDLKQTYSEATLVSGTDALGTGAKVKINGKEYTIIKIGDISKDGVVDARDASRILNYVVGSFEISKDLISAVDINKDGVVDARDASRILNYVVGSYYIGL